MLNFRTAYYDKDGTLITDKSAVAKRYATGWFAIDLGSTLPIAYIYYIIDPDSVPWRAVELQGTTGGTSSNLKVLKILRLFRLPKMLRLLKLKNLLLKHEDNEIFSRIMNSMSIIKLMVSLLYMSHFLACFWYIFGDLSETEMPDGTIIRGWVYRQHWGSYGWGGRYLTSFFHSITDDAMSYAETDTEKLWVSIQHVLYELFMAYLTGVFAGEVIAGNVAQQRYNEKMGEVKTFCRHHGLSFDLRRQVNEFYNHLNKTKTFFDEEQVLMELPPQTRKRVVEHIYAKMIDETEVKRNYPFLARLPTRLRYEIAQRLKPIPAQAGDLIYREGDYGEEMYFVDAGALYAYKHHGGQQTSVHRAAGIYATAQAEEDVTLHVRGIGGPTEEPGPYENFEALKQVFKPYGEVVDVVVRHRVEDGHNTSWALVTMESEASAQKALDNEVFAGKQKLVINPYKAKQAAASDGAMAKTRNRQLKVQERAQEMAMAKGKGKSKGKGNTANFSTTFHKDYGAYRYKFNDGNLPAPFNMVVRTIESPKTSQKSPKIPKIQISNTGVPISI